MADIEVVKVLPLSPGSTEALIYDQDRRHMEQRVHLEQRCLARSEVAGLV